ncbi:MAG: DUF2304 domain-containing protein [Desulfosoma sp.]
MKPSPQWVSSVIGILVCVIILSLLRRDRLQVRYALWWLSVAAAAFLLGMFPWIMDDVGRLLGVHYPPVLVLVAATALLFLKSLTQDMDRCRREQNMRRLAQRLAILEARLEAMEKKRCADTEEKPLNMPETDEKPP